MPATIKEIIKIVESFGYEIKSKERPENTADALLGKFKGAIPEGKTSTEIIKELRSKGYDKY